MRTHAEEERMLNQFAQAFMSVTGMPVELSPEAEIGHGFRPDGLLTIGSPGWPKLLLEHKSNVYPRDIREFIQRLESSGAGVEQLKAQGYQCIMVSERLSDSVRADLRERGLGYYDASGSMFIKSRDCIVVVERPPVKAAERQAQALYTGAAGNVVLALLDADGRWRSGTEIAEAAGVSGYTASTVLRAMALHELVQTKGEGRASLRRLAKPAKVLDAWCEARRARSEKTSTWHFFTQNPAWLVNGFAGVILPLPGVAFTGAAAANVYSPLLTAVDTIELIVPPGESESKAKLLGLKSVSAGGNVRLIEREVPASLFRVMTVGDHEARLVPPAMAYADCLDGKGRKAELSRQLREEVLKVDLPLARGDEEQGRGGDDDGR